METINTDVVREYLKNAGLPVSDSEFLTQKELGHFADELQHKTGAARTDILASLDNVTRLPAHAIEHVKSMVGNVADNADAAKAKAAKAQAADAAKAAQDAAEAAAKAKAEQDAADAAELAELEASDAAEAAAKAKAEQDAADAKE